MSDSDTATKTRRRTPWLLTGFDLEGVVGAVAAWLVGVLLGLAWAPLFWLGVVAAIVILMATRRSERFPIVDPDAVLAPCDGVVAGLELVEPPPELRLPEAMMRRVRIASSPATTNTLRAPIGGVVSHMVSEIGDPSVVVAGRPDMDGLETRLLTIDDRGLKIGLRVAAAGLGPRIELQAAVGDPARPGHKIGVRRLGGWTDVFVPANALVDLSEGRTLVGGETVLCRLVDRPVDVATGEAEAEAPPEPRRDAPAVPKSGGERTPAAPAAAAAAPLVDTPDEEPVVEPAAQDDPMEVDEVRNEGVDALSNADDVDEADTADEAESAAHGAGDDDDETAQATARLFEKLKRQAEHDPEVEDAEEPDKT